MRLPPGNLFFARVYYFTFMGGWGFVLPFMNLFLVSLGLSGKQVGLISSVNALVGMITSPIWVSEVKKHPRAQWLLQLAILLGAIGYFLIGHQTEFLFILLLVFLHSLAASGIMPLSDSMAVTVAEEANTGYGSVRAWASLGWIGSVLASGWLVERFGYLAAFTGVATMWIIASVVVAFIHPDHFSSKLSSAMPQTNLKLAFQRVIHNRTLLGFAFALIVIGFLNSGVLQFEYVFLEELGASKRLISVAGILSAIVELPFMIYADRIVRRVGGLRLILVAMSLTCIQRLIVFLFPAISTILVIRFIGGVAFSFYTVAFVNLISTQTAAWETGTVLALYTVTIGGLVNIIAAPVAGAIYDAIGAHWLYLLSAIGYGTGGVSLWLTRPYNKAN
jgi:PPP family 3-phenylpropionic acid transporter